MSKVIIGSKIRDLRKKKGKEIYHVAKELGLKSKYYKKIEKGQVILDATMIEKIANYYDVSVDFLLNDEVERTNMLNIFLECLLYNKGKLFCLLTFISLVLAIIVNSKNVFEKKTDFSPKRTVQSTENPGSGIKIEGDISINGDQNVTIIGNDNEVTAVYKETDAIIEIVDIKIKEDKKFPVLDIKVRNRGDKIAYLHSVTFHMLDYTQLANHNRESYYEVEPSGNYDIMLSKENEQVFDVSQAVPADNVDRFTLTLATNSGDPDVPAICYFYLDLLYNQNDVISTSKMIIPINNPREWAAKHIEYTDLDVIKENYDTLLKFEQYDDAIKSSYYNEIFECYKEFIFKLQIENDDLSKTK